MFNSTLTILLAYFDFTYVLKLLVSIFVVLIVAIAVYNRYFHPLHNIPGPFWASITPLWYAYAIQTSQWQKYQLPIHEQYGSMVRLAPNFVQFADAEAIDTIYGAKHNLLKSHFYTPFDSKLAARPDNFAETNDEMHTMRRRAVAQIYTQASALEYEPGVDRIIRLFINQMTALSQSGAITDMSDWLRRYALDVVGEIFYGRSEGFGCVRDRADYKSWIQLMEVAVTPIATSVYVPAVLKPLYFASQLLFANGRAGLFGYLTLMSDSKQALKQRHDDIAAQRPVNQNDVLSKLLAVVDDKNAKYPMVLEDVVAELLSVIFAGADTTATSLISIFYHVHKHPKALGKLKAEICDAFDAGKLTYPVRFNDAVKLPYLRAVVNESMRIHPSLGLNLPRVVPDGGLQICGRYFPGGVEVGINAAVVHFDRKVFGEDSHEFLPERWIRGGDRVSANMERHIMQFGYGKRICIGKHISYTEMYKLLPTILHQYDFEFTSNKAWQVARGWFQQQKNVNVIVSRRTTVDIQEHHQD